MLRTTWMGTLTAALVAAALVGSIAARCALAPDALAGEEQKPPKSVDPAKVYYGDSARWDKPAEIRADDVYAQIDEYKQILKDGLQPGDAKYEILMTKATRRFRHAVKRTARDNGYDLVAEVGAVKGVDSVPDITQSVISAL